MSRPASRTLLLDFLAARTGGQLTRARAFLGRVRTHDPDTRLHILHADGALGFVDDRRDLVVDELHFAAPGVALRRIAWQNLRLPALLRSTGANGYLTFSHDLPSRFPETVPAIVGVANLAPFSADARAAETRMAARLRLDLLARTIVSSARRARCVIALSETCRGVLVDRGIDAGKIEVIPNGVDVLPGIEDPATRSTESPATTCSTCRTSTATRISSVWYRPSPVSRRPAAPACNWCWSGSPGTPTTTAR